MKIKASELKKMINEAIKRKLREEMNNPVCHQKKLSRPLPRTTRKENLNEEGYKKSVTWGDIPEPEELYNLMDGEAFEMELRGADSLAWDYAMDISPNPRAGSTAPGEGLHASLVALIETPEPDELSDGQYEDVEQTLDRWNKRYGDQSIAETAWSLASGIMGVLNIEWV